MSERSYPTRIASHHEINGLVSGFPIDLPGGRQGTAKPWLNVARPQGATVPNEVIAEIYPSDPTKGMVSKKIKIPGDRDVGFFLYDHIQGPYRLVVRNSNDHPFACTVTTPVV